MLFSKKKKHEEEDISALHEKLALTSLIPLCGEGRVMNSSFVIEDKDICVYADVALLKDNVAQIVYQLHHSWLEEPIMESVAASGDSIEDAIHQVAQSFFDNVLTLFLQAIDHPETAKRVRVVTQEPHDYNVYRGAVNGVGRREGALEGDFWDMLQEDILSCLHNQKAYWVKIFSSKNKNNIICEVRINNQEISSLSEKMVEYAENWECKDSYHTEKQGILLIQEEGSIKESTITKEDIIQLSKEGIRMFEACTSREDYLNIRKELFKKCKDVSLTHEIFFLIPEFYCEYAYPQVEFGDKLYLIRKNEKTKELQQSQMYSFAHVQHTVHQHIQEDKPTQETIEHVLAYSANAKAIHKALENGSTLEELMIPGIGVLIPSDYKLR